MDMQKAAGSGESEGIDRTAFEPVYAQLVNILRRQVASGFLRPGDQLPSEAQLCRRYGISPMTVRRAINILVDQGIVVAEQGRGTFIRPVELGTASFQLQRLQELFEDDPRNTVRLLQARIMAADERTAAKLQVAPGQRVIYIRRLILACDEPTLCHVEYVVYDPARPVVEAEMDVTALRGLFGGAGATMLKHGDLSVEATLLTEEEAALLQASRPAAAFRIEHLFFDFDDRPVSWGWFICRSDRLRFTSRLGLRGAE
ncbi:MAG: GntR family transcriptional regulator [Anaerolineales bacterium]|nr:GntR family transcriptional regulator [Anaerolineales bacterium]